MAKWLSTLSVKDFWHLPDEEKISYADFARMAANRLEAYRLPKACQEHQVAELSVTQAEIVQEFMEAASESEVTAEDLNPIIAKLYDWADTTVVLHPLTRLCWVETF